MFFSLSQEKGNIRSKGFWKFNSSLIKDQKYINEIKDLIRNFDTKNDCNFSRQLKWEFLKYEIRKFTIHYTKGLAKERKQKILNLESELKKLEISLGDANNLGQYNSIKNELEAIYDHIAEGIRIRSKCDWYEHGEKSTIFFENLEKQRGVQNTIKKLIIDDTEVTDQTCILNHIKDFYEALFKKREQKTTAEIKDFLNVIDVPKLSEDQVKLCEEDLTEKDLYKSLRSMQNDKSPGNDGLTKEFYETFWDDLKEIFVNSVRESKEIGHLSTSQRQACIKLIEKKGER